MAIVDEWERGPFGELQKRLTQRREGAENRQGFLCASASLRETFSGSLRRSDVEVLHVAGVLLDELAARLHLFAHQPGEDIEVLQVWSNVQVRRPFIGI
jgi:hypothetical protein